MRNRFGELLRKYREDRGVSTKELSSMMRKGSSYVSQVETGRIEPSIEYVELMVQALPTSDREKTKLRALAELYEAEQSNEEVDNVQRAEWVVTCIQQAQRIEMFSCSVLPHLIRFYSYKNSVLTMKTDAGLYPALELASPLLIALLESNPQWREVTAIICEAALRTKVGISMDAQCALLIDLIQRFGVDIRILPMNEDMFDVAPLVDFTLLDRELAVIDHFGGFDCCFTPSKLGPFIKVFQPVVPQYELQRRAKGEKPKTRPEVVGKDAVNLLKKIGKSHHSSFKPFKCDAQHGGIYSPPWWV